MYLPVQAQSNPKLSYFEHARNFSDIFQIINNITMVVIGIYTLTQIISHHHVELKSTLCILYHTCTLSNRQLYAIVVLFSFFSPVNTINIQTTQIYHIFRNHIVYESHQS
jgi:hypothetical protein